MLFLWHGILENTQWNQVQESISFFIKRNAQENHSDENAKGSVFQMGKRWVRGHLIALKMSLSLSSDQLQLQLGYVTYTDLEQLLYSEEPQRMADIREREKSEPTHGR